MRFGLYAITSSALYRGRSLESIVAGLIAGGATCIQLREKDFTARELMEAGRLIRRMTAESGVAYIVNDRVDIAILTQADGVHLGQKDISVTDARKIMGTSAWIGVSTHSEEEAVRAEREGADYIGVGPMRDTRTKTDTEPVIGPDGLARIRRSVRLPIVAIGGIDLEDIDRLIGAGADAIAVISALYREDDVEAQARRFTERIEKAKAARREGGLHAIDG
jgi:thiamine-phosphate pyrophosphorylase